MTTRTTCLNRFIDSHNGHGLPLFLKKERIHVHIHYSLYSFQMGIITRSKSNVLPPTDISTLDFSPIKRNNTKNRSRAKSRSTAFRSISPSPINLPRIQSKSRWETTLWIEKFSTQLFRRSRTALRTRSASSSSSVSSSLHSTSRSSSSSSTNSTDSISSDLNNWI